MYENKIIGDIHASRYIASWVREGGSVQHTRDMDKWLKTLGLSERDRNHITYLATNGKLELEYSARRFLAEQKIPK